MKENPTYDVFLSHNNADKDAIELIARRLREEGDLTPFLDRWHLIPGEPWQEALEEAIDASRSCAVFLGPAGLGSWENEQMRAALDIRVQHPAFRVIPVLLPGASLPERGRLPRFLARLTWVDFRPGLDDADAFHRLVCGIQGIAPGPEGAAEAEIAAVCPFRGLQVFDEEHAPFFFGREALTQHLVEQLRTDRFLAVIGPSGSGKSSLVRAGLLPQVRAGALPASERWPVVVLKPGLHPVETLAARLLPHLGEGADPLAARGSLLDALAGDERGLHTTVQVALASDPDSLRLLLVIDQFEELFTLCRDGQARADFIANLLYASGIAGGQTVAVVTMRADFFGKCAAHPDLAARLAERDVLVGPMSEEELRRAMEGPAEAVGLHYEKGLVETILDDLGDEPGSLPLLQHTLLELWERRRGGWLTADAYHEIGGVKGALAQRADEVYAGLTQEQQAAARRVLLRLTQPGEGTEDTRRRAPLTELLPAEGGATDTEAAVQELASARLLTTGEDEQGDEIVDVAHEALIRGWPRLQGWIDEDRAALRTHRQLTEAAQEWVQEGRDGSYLYRGARLAEAQEWAESHAGDLNPLERAFLEASVGAREAEQVAARRRVRGVVAGLAVALAIFAGLAFVAFQQRDKAITRGQEAERARADAEYQGRIAQARALAAQAEIIVDENPQLAVLLGLEAVYQTYRDTPDAVSGASGVIGEAYSALHRAAARSRWLATLRSGHTNSVNYAAWSSDDARIVTTSWDGNAKVWDASVSSPTYGQELLTFSGHNDRVVYAAWSSDDSRIVTASWDRTAKVWDASASSPTYGRELVTLAGHGDAVRYAAWSSDDARIMTVSDDGSVKVWDASASSPMYGQELFTLAGQEKPISRAAWNPDSTRIATVGGRDVKVWNATSGRKLFTLTGHTSSVWCVAWSPNGARIATADAGGGVKVWDASASLPTYGRELFTLAGHSGEVQFAAWSSDGARLVTASDGGSAKVWDTSASSPTYGQELFALAERMGNMRHLAWSPDDARIATASSASVQVWDASASSPTYGQELFTLVGLRSTVQHLAWSSDGARIVAVSSTGAKVWDASASSPTYDRELVTLGMHNEAVWRAAWSPDSTRIAMAGGGDGSAKVWDASASSPTYGRELFSLDEHRGSIRHVAWSPDGTRIATASADESAKVWDASASSPTYGQELFTLAGHSDAARRVAWSPDGARIVTTNEGGSAKVWDVSTPLNTGASASSPTYGRELFTLAGHTGPVHHAAWSPDGTRIVTAGGRDVKVWDASASSPTYGRELLTLAEYTGSVGCAAWSPDGTRIVTTSGDGSTKVWDASASSPTYGRELLFLDGHRDSVRHVAWSPDGTRIATASADRSAKVWDASASSPTYGQELFALVGHSAAVQRVVWSPDGTRIATASADRSAKVWDVSTPLNTGASASSPTYGRELFILTDYTGPINDVAWSPDGAWIVTVQGSTYGRVKVWDARTGTRRFTLAGHMGPIYHAPWGPDDARVVTASDDGSAKVWDASASSPTYGRELVTLTGHGDAVQHVAWSADGTRVATASADGSARVWDASASSPTYGKELFILVGHRDVSSSGMGYSDWVMGMGVVHVAWSSDGARLATAGADGSAKVWDASTSSPTYGEELLTLAGHSDAIQHVAWSSSDARIMTASADGSAKVWDASASSPTYGEELVALGGYLGPVYHAAWSSDDARIVTASHYGSAKVWDASASSPTYGEELFILGQHSDMVLYVAWSSDDTRIVTAGGDGRVRVWDASASSPMYGREELATLVGHSDAVLYAAWSSDDARIMTASADGSAKVWDASPSSPTYGRELFTLGRHVGPIYHAAWSSDDAWIVTAGADGNVRIYFARPDGPGGLIEFACSRANRNLTHREWERYMGADVPYRRTCPDLPVEP